MSSPQVSLLQNALREAESSVSYRRQLFDLQHSKRYRNHKIDIARVIDCTLERRAKTKGRLIEMVKALCRIFTVDDDFEFRHFRKRFDAFGWRRIDHEELMRVSSCTPSQVKASLRDLEEAGFLSRRNPQIGPNRRALLVRLNAAKINNLLAAAFPGEAEESVTVRVMAENAVDSDTGCDNGYPPPI
jgi:hypothetical protein